MAKQRNEEARIIAWFQAAAEPAAATMLNVIRGVLKSKQGAPEAPKAPRKPRKPKVQPVDDQPMLQDIDEEIEA